MNTMGSYHYIQPQKSHLFKFNLWVGVKKVNFLHFFFLKIATRTIPFFKQKKNDPKNHNRSTMSLQRPHAVPSLAGPADVEFNEGQLVRKDSAWRPGDRQLTPVVGNDGCGASFGRLRFCLKGKRIWSYKMSWWFDMEMFIIQIPWASAIWE